MLPAAGKYCKRWKREMNEFIQSVKDNASFLLVCLLVFLALFAIAALIQKYCLKTVKEVSKARRVSYIAMFSVLAAVLMFLEIPLFFAPSFYEIDFSEVPVLICTFYLSGVVWIIIGVMLIVSGLMRFINAIISVNARKKQIPDDVIEGEATEV